MQANSDSILWDKFKRGDKNAFKKIYQLHAQTLLNYGYKITHDTSLIEDSIQDLFVELWKSGAQLSATTSIKFYLFRALRWKINRNRNNSHSNEMLPLEGYMALLKDAPYEEFLIELQESEFKVQHLLDKLKKLPARQREAINLRYFHNFVNEEVAQIMGISYNSASKVICAGLKNLRQYLKKAV